MDSLTQSQEDYLETVLAFVKEDGHAHVKDIAKRLNVRMASVTGALRTLNNAGLVNYQPYGTVTLTQAGESAASTVSQRHELLERFMHRILGVDAEVARDNACRIEHTMSEDVLQRLAKYVAFVEECPAKACTWQAEEGAFCGEKGTCNRKS